jgi:1,4-dihydroxy-2-naphthoate polyprenyltransferase
MTRLKSFLGQMRVPFLLLPPACVALGLGAAVWRGAKISFLDFALVLVGAVTAHISVNVFNEYSDFKSGLDRRTQRTPFSGGSGTLPAEPILERQALVTGIAALALTITIGIYFLMRWGLELLPLGALGIVLILSYTRWITRRPILCLLAPGLGFGVLMVIGTSFVLSGEYSWPAFVASLVPFFLVSDLLLLNQFPDVEADRTVGRRHLLIAAGRSVSSIVFAVFLALAYVTIVFGVVFGLLPHASLLGLITMVLAVPTAYGALRYADDIERLKPFMALNVAINFLTLLLVAAGFFID